MSVNQHKEMGKSRSNIGEDSAEKRAPRRRSDVWDHFTLNKVTKRAICNHCKVNLQGDSKKGTSHLKRHMKNKHPYEYASTAEDTTVFGPESGEINGASGASTSSDKKRAPLAGEPMEDNHVVGKQARLNKEKQLKESGVIPQQNILTGDLLLQIQNGSNTKFGEALKIFFIEHSQLTEQNNQLETQIKKHTEALDRARVETREQTEARFAAESVRTLDLDKLHNEKARTIKEALQIPNDSNLELGEALEISISEYSQLIEWNRQLETQIKQHKEALYHAREEIREQTEARFAAENKVRALTLECDKLSNEKAQIKEALDRARVETKEVRVAAEREVSDLNKTCDVLQGEIDLAYGLYHEATNFARKGGGSGWAGKAVGGGRGGGGRGLPMLYCRPPLLRMLVSSAGNLN